MSLYVRSSKPKKSDVDKLCQAIVKAPVGDGIAQIHWIDSEGTPRHSNGECHATFGSNVYNNKSISVFGEKFCAKGYTTSGQQTLYSWLLDPEESIYSDLLKYLRKKDAIHVARDDKGLIHGFVVTTRDVNRYVLFNFFKQVRYTSEHPSMFSFWKKWAVDKGKNPRVAYFMGAFYNCSGSKKSGVGHGPIEQNVRCCDFRKILYGGGGLWVLSKETLNEKETSYYGEQVKTWGSDEKHQFDWHKDIPVISSKEEPTRFWTKYYGVGRQLNGSLTDETISYFLDNAEKIYKEKIL